MGGGGGGGGGGHSHAHASSTANWLEDVVLITALHTAHTHTHTHTHTGSLIPRLHSPDFLTQPPVRRKLGSGAWERGYTHTCTCTPHAHTHIHTHTHTHLKMLLQALERVTGYPDSKLVLPVSRQKHAVPVAGSS